MSIHSGYIIETVLMSVSSFIFFLGCISLWLTYRFTPKKKWILTKIILTSIASVAVIFQLIRGMDSHGVFGLFDVPTQHALQSMTTGTLLHGGAEILFTSTRSFYVMLNKPLTKFLRPLYFGATIVNHVTLLVLVVVEAATYETDDDEDLEKLYSDLVAKDVCFDVMAVSILAVSFWSLYGLRKAVTVFIATLSSQQGWVNGSTPLARPTHSKGHSSGPQSPSHELPSSAKETDHADPVFERQVSDEEGLPGVVEEIASSTASATKKPQLTVVIASVSSPPTTTVSPASTLSPVSAAATRIDELRAAESKLNRLMMSICFILLLGIASSIPHFIVYGSGQLTQNLDDYITSDPTVYPPAVILLPIVQSTVIAIMIWYAWVSPSVWWSSPYPFWSTLIHGLPTEEIASPSMNMAAAGIKYQRVQSIASPQLRLPSTPIAAGAGTTTNVVQPLPPAHQRTLSAPSHDEAQTATLPHRTTNNSQRRATMGSTMPLFHSHSAAAAAAAGPISLTITLPNSTTAETITPMIQEEPQLEQPLIVTSL